MIKCFSDSSFYGFLIAKIGLIPSNSLMFRYFQLVAMFYFQAILRAFYSSKNYL